VRTYRPEDTERIAALLLAALPNDPVHVERLVTQVLLDPNFDNQGAIVAVDGGCVVGFCLAIARKVPMENAPPDDERGYITIFGVAESHGRSGVGSSLLDTAEAFLRFRERSHVWVSAYSPGYFWPGVDVDMYSSALDFLVGRGYGEVYRPIGMECPLWRLERPKWLPRLVGEGRYENDVRITTCSPDLVRPLIEFLERVFKGDWVRFARDGLREIYSGRADPRRVLVAVTGQDAPTVVGFAHHDRERFGPIGVDPDARGQKIGQLLMFETLEAQRAQGFRTSWFLWSDDKTHERLYRSAGFREVRRFALMRKDL
jgi:mycothiol synthase